MLGSPANLSEPPTNPLNLERSTGGMGEPESEIHFPLKFDGLAVEHGRGIAPLTHRSFGRVHQKPRAAKERDTANNSVRSDRDVEPDGSFGVLVFGDLRVFGVDAMDELALL